MNYEAKDVGIVLTTEKTDTKRSHLIQNGQDMDKMIMIFVENLNRSWKLWTILSLRVEQVSKEIILIYKTETVEKVKQCLAF